MMGIRRTTQATCLLATQQGSSIVKAASFVDRHLLKQQPPQRSAA